MAEPVVFLDACVLYPPLVRGIVLGVAAAGLITPRWSPRVLAEWRIAAARNGGIEAEDRVDTAIAHIQARFPRAQATPEPDAELAHDLPDPADTHVLAAAIASGAEILLTFNLRDFPARQLARHGVTPRHPDGFLWQLFSQDPARMGAAIAEAASAIGAEGPDAVRRALKRAHLPRLAKAWRTQNAAD